MGRRPRLHMHRGPEATSEAREALTCLRRIRGDFIHIIFFLIPPNMLLGHSILVGLPQSATSW